MFAYKWSNCKQSCTSLSGAICFHSFWVWLELYCKYMLKFRKNYQTDVQSDCTILHAYPPCSNCSTASATLGNTLGNTTYNSCYCHGVISHCNCNPHFPNDFMTLNIFMYLLVDPMSPFVKCVFKSFDPLLWGCLSFYHWSVEILSIFWASPTGYMYYKYFLLVTGLPSHFLRFCF